MKNKKTTKGLLKKLTLTGILLLTLFAIPPVTTAEEPEGSETNSSNAYQEYKQAEQAYNACVKNEETEDCTAQKQAMDEAKAAASPSGGAQAQSEEYDKLMETIGSMLIMISEFLQRIIWPVLLLIGGLLKNDILFGAGMEETMLNIWRNIRNIVNILFILVLLGIAFYNVVGGSNQDYHIKTMLPKFIIALIAVNFSFLVVKVAVDAVSVVTTAVFALPNAVETNLTDEQGNQINESQKFIISFCEGLYGQENYSPPPDDSGYCVGNPNTKELTAKGKNFFATFDSNNAAIILAINMGKVAEINKVTLKNHQQAAKDLLLNTLFSTTLYIVYAVAFVALLIILAIRLVVLWVTMVLSPLIVLAYVIPDSLKSSLGGADDLSKKFVQNLIAPLPIALVMSIGFIMLQSWKQARFASVDIPTLDVNLLTSGMSTLQDLIAAVAMVVIVWIGVFEAAKGGYAESIVGGLKNAVESAGKFVATAPIKYMPLIPVGKGDDKVSVGTALGAVSQIPNALRTKELQKQRDLMKQFGFAPDEAISKEIKKTKNGTDLGATMWNHRYQLDKTRQKEIGDQLRDNPDIERDFRSLLGNKQFGEYKTAQVIDALKRGEELPDDVLQAVIDRLKDNSNVLSRASQLAGASAAAAGTSAAGTAGAASEQQTESQQPDTSTETNQQPVVDKVAEQVLTDEDKKKLNNANGNEDYNSPKPEEVAAAKARRDKATESLSNLQKKLQVVDSNNAQEAINTVKIAQEELKKQLESNGVPDDEIDDRVSELMRGYVQNMEKKYGNDHADQWEIFKKSEPVKQILKDEQPKAKNESGDS